MTEATTITTSSTPITTTSSSTIPTPPEAGTSMLIITTNKRPRPTSPLLTAEDKARRVAQRRRLVHSTTRMPPPSLSTSTPPPTETPPPSSSSVPPVISTTITSTPSTETIPTIPSISTVPTEDIAPPSTQSPHTTSTLEPPPATSHSSFSEEAITNTLTLPRSASLYKTKPLQTDVSEVLVKACHLPMDDAHFENKSVKEILDEQTHLVAMLGGFQARIQKVISDDITAKGVQLAAAAKTIEHLQKTIGWRDSELRERNEALKTLMLEKSNHVKLIGQLEKERDEAKKHFQDSGKLLKDLKAKYDKKSENMTTLAAKHQSLLAHTKAQEDELKAERQRREEAQAANETLLQRIQSLEADLAKAINEASPAEQVIADFKASDEYADEIAEEFGRGIDWLRAKAAEDGIDLPHYEDQL